MTGAACGTDCAHALGLARWATADVIIQKQLWIVNTTYGCLQTQSIALDVGSHSHDCRAHVLAGCLQEAHRVFLVAALASTLRK